MVDLCVGLCRFNTPIRAVSWAFAVSRGSVVLVDESAQDLPAAYDRAARGRRGRWSWLWRSLFQGLVGTVTVVMLDVGVQDGAQVAPAGD
jgi:hypothetical protein